MKIKNVFCPICHRRTYFTGKVVYESRRTEIIEWKCADCGAVLKSRHDKLGEEYNKRMKKTGLSPKPALWIRKGGYRDLLYFEVGRKLYAFRSLDVERLERDEILAIPVYLVLTKKLRKVLGKFCLFGFWYSILYVFWQIRKFSNPWFIF